MSIGSALSVMFTYPPGMTVGVVPVPSSTWPGFDSPLFGYVTCQTTFGGGECAPNAPSGWPAPNRYSLRLVAM